jgi:hypothetical protein
MARQDLKCAIVALSLLGGAAAGAGAAMVEADYTTTLDGGYVVSGTIIYDDALPVVSGAGTGPTTGIEFLDVQFFDPGGTELFSVVDVAGGVSSYVYLRAEFDTVAQNFVPGSGIDIGEDTGASGEYFLGGSVGGSASLFDVGAGPIDTTTNLTFGVTIIPRLVEADFTTTLDGGYVVAGTIIYDENIPVVSGSGTGPTNGIEFLDVQFFNPGGTELFSVIDVAGGVSSYLFLRVEFDTVAQNFVPGSGIDIGEDTGTPGEHYLVGAVGGSAGLEVVGVATIDTTSNLVFNVAIVPPRPRPGLYATDNGGNFFLIDPLTAAPTIISSGFACSATTSPVTELEFNNATNRGIVQDAGGAFRHNEVDFNTGLPTGPSIPNSLVALNGLEWINGQLYGVGISAPGTPSTLYVLDPFTGGLTPVGPTGVSNISGLALHPLTGVVYGVTAGPNILTSDLVTININTGLATLVGNTQVVLGSLEFGPGGLLYGGGGQGNANELWIINPVTAAATFVGNTGLGANAITGLAHVTRDDPPEPKRFFGINNRDPNTGLDELIRFEFDDPGSYTVVGPIIEAGSGARLGGLGGLDFNGDGALLYASDSFGPNPGAVYLVDPTTAVATLLGVVPSGELNDLAWDPATRDLYGVARNRLWANVDDPGAAIDLGPFSVASLVNVGIGFDCYGNLYVHDLVTDNIYVARTGSLTSLTLLHDLPFDSNLTQGLFVDWSRDNQGYHAAYNPPASPPGENYLFGTLPTGGGYGPLVGAFPDPLNVADLTCPPIPPCGFVNRSFETGDFTGWTTQDLPFPLDPLAVLPAGSPLFFSFTTPSDGVFSAGHGYDGDPGVIKIAQDVVVSQAQLRFDYRTEWSISGALPRPFDVVIRTPGGGLEIGRLNILLASGVQPDTGIVTELVDLSPFKGLDVQICFEWTIPESFTGPAQFELDNICLVKPCPGDVDGNDVVDVFDFASLAASFGKSVGDPDFLPGADLDKNGTIDVFDFAILAADFGCGTGI